MSFSFTFNIDIFSRRVKVRELSFYEYRNFVKTIATNDVEIISNSFNLLIKQITFKNENLNLQEKFLLLVKYREFILGKNIEYAIDDKILNYSTDNFFNFSNKQISYYEFEHNNHIYKFGLPKKPLLGNNLFDTLSNCLYFIDEEIYNDDLNLLPALPVIQLLKKITAFYENYEFKIKYIDYTLSFFDASVIFLLKSLFTYEIQGLYDIEYALRKNLQFSANDFNTLSFPECIIIIKMYRKEQEEESKSPTETVEHG